MAGLAASDALERARACVDLVRADWKGFNSVDYLPV